MSTEPQIVSKGVLRRLRYRATGEMRIVSDVVARYYNVPNKRKMLSKCRLLRYAWPRQVAMTLCIENRLGNFDEIAEMFSVRDHGSASHAQKAVHNYCRYKQIAVEVAEVRKLVKDALCQKRTKSSPRSTKRSRLLNGTLNRSRLMTPSRG